MSATYLFTAHAPRGLTVLPRIALALARRRLEPARLRYAVAEGEADRCLVEFELACPARTAERLRAQLARMVELDRVELARRGRDAASVPPPPAAVGSVAGGHDDREHELPPSSSGIPSTAASRSSGYRYRISATSVP